MSRRVVLFALNDLSLRSTFNQTLATTSHALVFCTDGSEGFDRFLEARPDVCIVSEEMTGVRGLVLARLIKEQAQSRGVGFFLLSKRYNDEAFCALASDAGVDHVLPESPDITQLVAAIEGPYAFERVEGAEFALESSLAEESAVSWLHGNAVAGSEMASSDDEAITLLFQRPEHIGENNSTPAFIELTSGMRKTVYDIDAQAIVTALGQIADGNVAVEDNTAESKVHLRGTEGSFHDTERLQLKDIRANLEQTPSFGSERLEMFDASTQTDPGAEMQSSDIDDDTAEALRASAKAPTQELAAIYPLSADEKDSDTIRRAIAESPLGRSLTRRILALHRLLDAVDYYQLLGVSNNATMLEVQQVFHLLACEYHPDRFFSLTPGFVRDRVHALFNRMSEAYSVLSHPSRRARYDQLLASRSMGPPPRYSFAEHVDETSEQNAEAFTPVGRKYLRLAMAALTQEDLDAAQLNLTFALGHEPENKRLRERLIELEQQMIASTS